jgi:hypothetical protein
MLEMAVNGSEQRPMLTDRDKPRTRQHSVERAVNQEQTSGLAQSFSRAAVNGQRADAANGRACREAA